MTWAAVRVRVWRTIGMDQKIERDHVYVLDSPSTWLLAVAMRLSDESDPISTGCNFLAAFPERI